MSTEFKKFWKGSFILATKGIVLGNRATLFLRSSTPSSLTALFNPFNSVANSLTSVVAGSASNSILKNSNPLGIGSLFSSTWVFPFLS